jgi:SAP domain-containing ribonucleoprotein
MTDYSKRTNAELGDLLKARSLPHTGKKAELIARLQEHDAKEAAANTQGATATKEDEIDWDDDQPAASTAQGAAAIAAGGKGQVPNPTAVPNQVVAEDASKTDDLTVTRKLDNTANETSTGAPAVAPKTSTTEETKAEPAKPATDFSSHLPTTSVDDELARRKKRAERFGIKETTDESLKALERAKRFGTVTETDAVKGIDSALPDRPLRGERKRGREGADNAEGRGAKRQDSKQRNGNNRQARGGRTQRSGGGREEEGEVRGSIEWTLMYRSWPTRNGL